ncbi:MAG: efflux RND transporter permease subunit, partial [Myxococcales bacterium]|nr:efflux RND transporter permease subunit [Myxococcales bacterium]
MNTSTDSGLFHRFVSLVLDNRLIVFVLVAAVSVWGLAVSPFSDDWGIDVERVEVDALPNLGENQQLLRTDWPGASAEDVETYVTEPLASAMGGIAGVRTVRAASMYGRSTVFLIFDDGVDFYWSRARVVEKLASLPDDLLPDGVQPSLGPDATALGQIFWYTLEGRDPTGRPVGGWDLQELRTIQDEQVRDALQAVDGVAEVAAIGGFERELVVEAIPSQLHGLGISLGELERAVASSSLDVGAGTTELNGVEYIVRGVGRAHDLDAVASAVVAYREQRPILVSDVANVSYAPAPRRGALDRGGAEAVGGVVVASAGADTREVLAELATAVSNLQSALPSRIADDGTESQVTVVPFYDRGALIDRTIGTLQSALSQQIIITILVVLLLMAHVRSSLIVSALLPLAILFSFAAMRAFDMPANIVSLAGIAIAIGSMVDIGIVLTESIVRRRAREPERPLDEVVRAAVGSVAAPVTTAVATTLIGFLPVFFLGGQEGQLFRPLAATKSFALTASLLLGLCALPPFAAFVLREPPKRAKSRAWIVALSLLAAVGLLLAELYWLSAFAALLAVWLLIDPLARKRFELPYRRIRRFSLFLAPLLLAAFVLGRLAQVWSPLGALAGSGANLAFTAVLVLGTLGAFWAFERLYPRLLRLCLRHKLLVFSFSGVLLVLGGSAWLGFDKGFGWLPEPVRESRAGSWMSETFPGLQREFMPPLDEGQFLYMPSAMFHASIGEVLEMLSQLDALIEQVPEVEYAVGKLGRADSALDTAPVAMIESIINVVPEYRVDDRGRRIRYRVDESGLYVRGPDGGLIEDPDGVPYRNWRPQIRTAQDVWDQIASMAAIPGLTRASKLQPIQTRRLMLQSGIRAPMAVQLRGDNLESLAAASLEIEALLRDNASVEPTSVLADRPVGKPYLDVVPNRDALARFGVTMANVQRTVRTAIGGTIVGEILSGQERIPLRVRY